MNRELKSQSSACVLIVLFTLVAYLPALRGGFVWDDVSLITDNRLIHADDGLYRIWLTTEPADYYPVTNSLWWLEWRLWGNHAEGYHLVNVLFHAANAVLLWVILRQLRICGAWLAALIFAIHPVNVASVAWISEQKNTLSMLFYCAAILLYLKFETERRWCWYGLSLVAFLLALLSKSTVVMLPVLLLGCAWWRRGAVRKRDFLFVMPFFGLSFVLGLVTVWFQYNRVLQGLTVRTEGFWGRLATAGCVPWFYLYKALVPLNLMVHYPKWNLSTSSWESYAPGIVLIGSLAVVWWKRLTWGRPWTFGLGYFVVTLLPVSGFVDQGFFRYSLVADHWQYIAIIAPIALVVAGSVAIAERHRSAGATVRMVVLIVLGVATWKRSGMYQSDETLWRDTLAKNPRSWLAHTNLGETSLQAGMVLQAYQHYEQALQIKPDYAPAEYDLGLILWQAGKTQEAVQHWKQAIQLEPSLGRAHYTLGVALMQDGKTNEAIQHWEESARLDPDDADVQNDLGSALLLTGKIRDAIEHYERALKYNPGSAEMHCNLAIAFEQVGKAQHARSHYEQALRLKPGCSDAKNGLARLQPAQ